MCKQDPYRCIKHALNFESHRIYHSYVVFGEKSILMDIGVNSTEVRVINKSKLNETLLTGFSRFLSRLNDHEINMIDQQLITYTMRSNTVKKAHIASLKSPVK